MTGMRAEILDQRAIIPQYNKRCFVMGRSIEVWITKFMPYEWLSQMFKNIYGNMQTIYSLLLKSEADSLLFHHISSLVIN